MNNYVPPFTITNKMLEYISSIMEKIGKIDNYTNLEKCLILEEITRLNLYTHH